MHQLGLHLKNINYNPHNQTIIINIKNMEDDWYKKEQKCHYIIHVNNYCLNQTAPDFEKAQARPLLRFALK